MAKRRSMTRSQNYDNDGGVPWSDLNHDVLLLVMMRLGVVDFVSFSGVCKSWRSLALANRKKLMASTPPMYIDTSTKVNDKNCFFSLKDFGGRKFKTLLPHLDGRKCVGLTCGYLILFGRETNDFWLVNPITRHQLHFPDFPYDDVPFHVDTSPQCLAIRAILVFSPSISGWLFVITERLHDQIWFSIADKGVWNHVHVSTTFRILDLHAFKGKIYILNIDYRTGERHLCEMRLGLEPKLMLLETKNFPNANLYPDFVGLDENLHVYEYFAGGSYKVHKLDFGEMKWVYCEKIAEKYAFYFSGVNSITTAINQETWAGTDKSRKCRFNVADMWYFPHDCLNVNLIDE